MLGWLGVFIAPTTNSTIGEGCCRWSHRTVWCATGHCPMRQPCHPTVRVLTVSIVGALSSWGTGQSSAAPDRHCSRSGVPSGGCSDSAWTVRALCVVRRSLEPTVVLASRCSAGTPDSSVAHRIVWWIIAERPSRSPKVRSWSRSPLVHRTLSGGTPDSRCARPGFSSVFCSFLLNPNFDLFIGLCWTFGACRIYNLEQTS
jgi:hypothetical protein